MKLLDSLWKMATMLLLGVVAGLVAAMKLMDPGSKVTNIEAQNYTEKEEQKVGKIKQRGNDNDMQAQVDGQNKADQNREKRRQRRRERKDREKQADKDEPLSDQQYRQVSERLSGY